MSLGIAQTLFGAVLSWATYCMMCPIASPPYEIASATTPAVSQRSRNQKDATPSTPRARSAKPTSHWNMLGA